MYLRLTRAGLNRLDMQLNPMLNSAPKNLGGYIQARVSASRTLPLTLTQVTALKFNNPLPTVASNLFAHWPTRALSTNHKSKSLVEAFTTKQAMLTPSGMSAVKFLSLADDEVLGSTSLIVDSFFPVDPPYDNDNILYINEGFREAFRQNANAREFQAKALVRIAKQLGFDFTNNQLCLDKNFSVKQCVLLATPNGRASLAQMIRSTYLLGNEKLAKDFQSILLAIGARYNIAVDKMGDIAFATAPDYWQKRDTLNQDPEAAARLIDTILARSQEHCFLNLADNPQITPFYQISGNLFADHILGIHPNQNGQYLKTQLNDSNENVILSTNDELLASLFPVEDTEDTKRCFALNPLLRSAHRHLARLFLRDFYLENPQGRAIVVKPDIDAAKLPWLKEENSTQRTKLLTIIKSLNKLHNNQFASNLRDCVYSNIDQHYLGSDKIEILQQLNQIVAVPSLLVQEKAPTPAQEAQLPEVTTPVQAIEIETYLTDLTQAITDFLVAKNTDSLILHLQQISNVQLSEEQLFSIFATRDASGKNLLDHAIDSKNFDVIQAILEGMRLVTEEDENGVDKRVELIQEIDTSTQERKTTTTILSQAVASQNPEIAKAVLAFVSSLQPISQFQLLEPNSSKLCPLSMAISNQQEQTFDSLLAILAKFGSQTKTDALQNALQQGKTPFITAVESNNLLYVQKLLTFFDSSAEPLSNQQKFEIFATLHPEQQANSLGIALINHNNEIAKTLLDEAKDFTTEQKIALLEQRSVSGTNALMLAIEQSDEDVLAPILALIDKASDNLIGALLTKKTPDKNNPLSLAIKNQRPEVARLLLNKINELSFSVQKADCLLNENNEDLTALELAVQQGYQQLVEEIVEAFFSLRLTRNEMKLRTNILESAHKIAKAKGLPLLVEYLAKVQDCVKNKKPLPKSTTVDNNFEAAVHDFIEQDDHSNLVIQLKNLPQKSLSETQKVVLLGKNYKGRSLLEIASLAGNKTLVKALLEIIDNLQDENHKVALLNPPNAGRNRALWLASFEGHHKCVKAILHSISKLTPSLRMAVFDDRQSDASAIFIAVQNQHKKTLYMLLNFIQQFSKDEQVLLLNSTTHGATPLLLATQHKNLTFVKALLDAIESFDSEQKLAVINAKDLVYGFAPLLTASANGDENIFDALLAVIASLESAAQKTEALAAKNHDGIYPAYFAAQNNHLACLNKLIAATQGLDDESKLALIDTVTSKTQCSAISIAAQSNHIECVKQLLTVLNELNDESKTQLLASIAQRGYGALLDGAANNHPDVVNTMLSTMTKLSPSQAQRFLAMKNQLGYNAIMLTAVKGYDQLLATLLNQAQEKTVDNLIPLLELDNEKTSALRLAATQGKLESVKYIVESLVLQTPRALDDNQLSAYFSQAAQAAQQKGHQDVSTFLNRPIAEITAELEQEQIAIL